jgi:histidinol-phosphate/aromatic aminotransferase/cobyric acid decarboxylase-like protein
MVKLTQMKVRIRRSAAAISGRFKIISSSNRYPDPRKAPKDFEKTSVRSILHGNGSDELIYYMIQHSAGVMYPVPTFSMYGLFWVRRKEDEIPLIMFDLMLKRCSRNKKYKPN